MFARRVVLGAPSARGAWAPARWAARAMSSATGVGPDGEPQRKKAVLTLEDGTRMEGTSFGADTSTAGEIVFNTGMVGYPESLTDPSYKGQMLTFTYPLQGNYGVPDINSRDEHGMHTMMESESIHVQAMIVQNYCENPHHWQSTQSLSEWLKSEGVPGISGLDTRLLTKKIRDTGTMLAKIEIEGNEPIEFDDPNVRNLVAEVSRKDVRVFGKGNPIKVVAVDCGIKNNIIRCLVARGVELKVVPFDYDFTQEEYDGLFLSNGPGDPMMASETIAHLKTIIDAKDPRPIGGICMGNQLLGLAAGATTYKLAFGNRGQNQPVVNLLNNQCFITPQNHGYAVETETLPPGWLPLFTNRNDGTNEGIMHESLPYFTAQFHPEARSGPTDTAFLFDMFLESIKQKKIAVVSAFDKDTSVYEKPEVQKVLMLGSGGLSIGQAGEFDYSGSQAIKALKEEGVKTVLMNPNIASVQTNLEGDNQADTVYFLPVTFEFVEEVIKREKPDGIVLSMGGQTALNVGIDLDQSGILAKYNVKVLGTPVSSIIATEDRDIFSQKLNEIGEKMAQSEAVTTTEAALLAAEKVGYPVMIRSAFALGGLGSGICRDPEHLTSMANKAFAVSPQILVEKSMLGWKEVEYEVVRDSSNNCITVCNMENFDALGVHTGDSIVVAPSQTLSDTEYHMLRRTAIRTVQHMGIIGECNIQYALHPTSLEYCIIEINPRLSRSSALASKATGYPLAFVAAKLALGINLPDIRNSVTQQTSACFEPSLDYIVCKVPRWDMRKFDKCDPTIGSAMKAVGEVMAVGRSFEESFQKALRMVDPSVPGYEANGYAAEGAELEQALVVPSDTRVHAIAHAMEIGMTVEELYKLTHVDPWFLHKLERIHTIRKFMQSCGGLPSMSRGDMLMAKQAGFSDAQISQCVGADQLATRAARKAFGIKPLVKQIDTLAAEFPAMTNYLYMTYNAQEHDLEFNDNGVMVLGNGAYRIGSSVEFDWCAVSCVRTLRKLDKKTIVVNYNPETVSTDYDECDRLYFEELSVERVLDIYEIEGSQGCVVSVGGQIPNNIALDLHQNDVKVLGTPPEMIDNAEDRNKFSALLNDIGVVQPEWAALTSYDEAASFSERVGYPVLIRPSYVLSGAAMNVVYSKAELDAMLSLAVDVSPDYPIVISKFVDGAREVDVDCIVKNGEVVLHAVGEHVENAGVHSGDATLVMPPHTVTKTQVAKMRTEAAKIAKALNISGPCNIQFLVKDDWIGVIECNVRAARTLPFVSKTLGVDFIDTATRIMVDEPINTPKELSLIPENPILPNTFISLKCPMFSFTRLRGADPMTGVEMASTGEVACFGRNIHEAFLKSLMSTTFKLPTKSILISLQERLRDDQAVLTAKRFVGLGFTVYATEATHNFYSQNGIPSTFLDWPTKPDAKPNCLELIMSRQIDLVLNIPNNFSERLEDNYLIRRTAADYGVPLLTNLQLCNLLAESLTHMQNQKYDPMNVREYYDVESSQEG